MKKLIIFTQNLDIGGVQKSVSTLANYLSKFYSIYIVLAEDNKEIKYKIDSKIKLLTIKTKKLDIEKKGIGKKIFKYRIREFDKILVDKSPDIVISYEDYNNLILLSTNFKCKKIISVRNSIKNLYKDLNRIHLLSNKFYYNNIKKLYPKADKIIAVSDFINKQLASLCNNKSIITIYNGIDKPKIHKEKKSKNKFILNVSRINKRKGQQDLIYAFNSIKDQIEHNLIIIGDGVGRDKLEKLIKELNLQKRIKLLGYCNPMKYLQTCELFVFPSNSEGFSNAILEAMSYSINIVSYNYDGSDEILMSNNLVTIGDISELSRRILLFLTNKKENKKAASILHNYSKNFTLNKCLLKYKNEITKVY